jgi:hypothetical protein
MTLDPALCATLRAALALLLLATARAKLRDRAGFRAALADYELLPPRAEGAAAAFLVAAEVGIGVGLLAPQTGRGASLAAGGLLALYAGAMAANLLRGRRHIDCGCGGATGGRPLGAELVARNALLTGAAALAALRVSGRPLVWLDAITVAAGLAACALLYTGADRALASAARLRAVREGSWSTP